MDSFYNQIKPLYPKRFKAAFFMRTFSGTFIIFLGIFFGLSSALLAQPSPNRIFELQRMISLLEAKLNGDLSYVSRRSIGTKIHKLQAEIFHRMTSENYITRSNKTFLGDGGRNIFGIGEYDNVPRYDKNTRQISHGQGPRVEIWIEKQITVNGKTKQIDRAVIDHKNKTIIVSDITTRHPNDPTLIPGSREHRHALEHYGTHLIRTDMLRELASNRGMGDYTVLAQGESNGEFYETRIRKINLDIEEDNERKRASIKNNNSGDAGGNAAKAMIGGMLVSFAVTQLLPKEATAAAANNQSNLQNQFREMIRLASEGKGSQAQAILDRWKRYGNDVQFAQEFFPLDDLIAVGFMDRVLVPLLEELNMASTVDLSTVNLEVDRIMAEIERDIRTSPISLGEVPRESDIKVRLTKSPEPTPLAGNQVRIEIETYASIDNYTIPVKNVEVQLNWKVVGGKATVVDLKTNANGRLSVKLLTVKNADMHQGTLSVGGEIKRDFWVDTYDYVFMKSKPFEFKGFANGKELVRVPIFIKKRSKNMNGEYAYSRPYGWEDDFDKIGVTGGLMKLASSSEGKQTNILYTSELDEYGRFSVYARSKYAAPFELKAWFKGGEFGKRKGSEDYKVAKIDWKSHPVDFRLLWGERMAEYVQPDGTVRFPDMIEEELLAKAELYITAQDVAGNPLEGVKPKFELTPADGIKIIGAYVETNENGEALFLGRPPKLYFPKAGETKITITAAGSEDQLIARVKAVPMDKVSILSPRDTDVIRERVVTLEGLMSGTRIARAILVHNFERQDIEISNGQFKHTVGLVPGKNQFVINAYDVNGMFLSSSNVVEVFAQIPIQDMRVVLTWDTPGTDVDLHVIDPNGEECYYSHKTTRSGGSLDIDDTDGFGPETYVIERAIRGEYSIRVNYFASNNRGASRCTITIYWSDGTRDVRRVLLFNDKENVLVERIRF